MNSKKNPPSEISSKTCVFYPCRNNLKANCTLRYFPLPKPCHLVELGNIAADSNHLERCSDCHKHRKWLFLCKIDTAAFYEVHRRYVCEAHFVEGFPSEMYPDPLPIVKIKKITGSKRNRKLISSTQTSLVKNDSKQFKKSDTPRYNVGAVMPLRSSKNKQCTQKIMPVQDFCKILSETSSVLKQAETKVKHLTATCLASIKQTSLQKLHKNEEKQTSEIDTIHESLSHINKSIDESVEDNSALVIEVLSLNKTILELEKQLQADELSDVMLDNGQVNKQPPVIVNPYNLPTILLVINDDQ